MSPFPSTGAKGSRRMSRMGPFIASLLQGARIERLFGNRVFFDGTDLRYLSMVMK